MKLWLKYLITFIIGALIAVAVFSAKELWVQSEKKEIIKIVCDGFTVPAILLLCFGGLCYCSSKGAFYGISYIFHILFSTHNWSSTKFSDRKRSYADYVIEKRGKVGPLPTYLIYVGLFYLLISIVFMIIFNNL